MSSVYSPSTFWDGKTCFREKVFPKIKGNFISFKKKIYIQDNELPSDQGGSQWRKGGVGEGEGLGLG